MLYRKWDFLASLIWCKEVLLSISPSQETNETGELNEP
jgi:hypothetical protein